jgi:hypothetical protein
MTVKNAMEKTRNMVEAGKHWLRELPLQRQLICGFHNYPVKILDLKFSLR